MTNIQDVLITPKDSPSIDAFGTLRVSLSHILLSGQLTYADNPLIWDTQLVNGGTAPHDVDESAVTLTASTTAGSEVIRQTKRYWLYRAGQGQLIRATFSRGTPQADIRKRVGYFDADDGVYLEINGTTDIALVHRSSVTGAPVDTRVTQANWNLDRLDGGGRSKVDLNFAMSQHLVIDAEWLGVGRVRVGFDVGGRTVYAHGFNFSNIVSNTAYMKTGSLPVRYEIRNMASAAGTFSQICASVVREGGTEEEGIPTAIRSPIGALLAASTTPQTAIAVQLKATHVRAFLKPTCVEIVNFGGAAEHVAWDLILNPALGGTPTYVSEGPASQAAKTAAQQQTYTGGGQVLASGVLSGTGGPRQNAASRLELASILGVASNIAGASDTLAVVVEAATGTPPVSAVLCLLELF